MKQEAIITAKTVAEAITKGAKQMNAPEENVKFEVLQEPKRGFLGIGEVPAKVKVIYTPEPAGLAFDFVEKIIRGMGIDAKTTLLQEGEKSEAHLSISGEDAGLLIGYHGETLDALQYLVNLAANKKSDDEDDRNYTKIIVDVENYREKREETLRSLARRMAQKVQRYKRSITLEPMSAYERRIIHSEVQNYTGVTTESIGVEGNRRVVIHLEGRPATSERSRGDRSSRGEGRSESRSIGAVSGASGNGYRHRSGERYRKDGGGIEE